MSDGGRERRKIHESHDLQRKPGTNSFARAVVRVGVGQICENEGFQAFQQTALDAFSDVAIRYMLDIGKTAVAAANFAGRTEPNAFDIIHGVEHLHSVVGFPGASEVDRCLLSSGAVREILNYVDDSEEIPFAYPLPHLPVLKDRRQNPSFVQSGEEPPQKHIPSWLPKFPICQTVEEKEPKMLEDPLSNSHHGITCNGSGPSKETKEEKSSGINPFLAEPISSGVKEVSTVVLPSEVDAQLNEVAGNQLEGKQASSDKSNEPNLGLKKVLSKQRPTVHFKFKSSKKFLGSALPSSLWEDDVHEKERSLIRDNGIEHQNTMAGEAPKELSIESPKERTLL